MTSDHSNFPGNHSSYSKQSLLLLPVELLEQILYELDGLDLVSCSQVCHQLYDIVKSHDKLWKNLCAKNLIALESCVPYQSYFDLYSSLFRHLWLAPAIWFGDKPEYGSIVISRYNPDNGALEAYEIICERQVREQVSTGFTSNELVSIGAFHPRPLLCLYPITRLSASSDYNNESSLILFIKERALNSCLLRVCALRPDRIHPSMSIWPPLKIPANDRARNSSSTAFRGHFSPGMIPSPDLFRLRKWLSLSQNTNISVNLGLTHETFSRLDPELLKSSPQFPWRGLWLGDYGLHGGEFVLFNQPSPERLEAIKLTGE